MGAWLLDYVSGWAGEWGFIRHANAQYRNPAFTGDATFLRGEIIDKRVDRKRAMVTISVEMTNQLDQVMAKARIDVELPQD